MTPEDKKYYSEEDSTLTVMGKVEKFTFPSVTDSHGRYFNLAGDRIVTERLYHVYTKKDDLKSLSMEEQAFISNPSIFIAYNFKLKR